jgi:SAM-dependent methyltransferase
MVHALQQCHRVLRPEGALIDLRPAAVHRLVGIETADRFRRLAVMRERFTDERAADRAIARVVREGLFTVAAQRRFPCDRTMDTVREFEEWLETAIHLSKWPRHGWLVRRVARRLEARVAGSRIVVRGPMDLAVLRKR